MIEKALYEKLTASPDIAQIVGTRVYPVFLPEKVQTPALVFVRVSTDGAFLSHDGTNGIITSGFEISCLSKTVTEAKALARLVRRELSGFSGTVSGVKIYRASVDGEFDDYDYETGLYSVPIEVYLTHDED